MIPPLFDKNQIFKNMYKRESLLKNIVGSSNAEPSQDYIDVGFSYLCSALGVNYQEFMDEYNNFKKSVDI